MKKWAALLIFHLMIGFQLHSQSNYEIDQVNGQTITTCSGSFTDSGGGLGNYSADENYTVTFCPASANEAIQIDFTTLDVIPGDQLSIFDGNSTLAPAFGVIDNNTSISTAVATSANVSGCLTVQFTSGSTNEGMGWIGTISCVFPCQDILVELESSTPAAVPLNGGYIDICQGETITFQGSATFPQNGTFYNQSTNGLSYRWTFGDGVSGDTGRVVSHTFAESGGYLVQLWVEDQYGCSNANLLNQRVRVSTTPVFAGLGADNYAICVGDSATLSSGLLSGGGSVVPMEETFKRSYSRADSIFLPDGNGTCYQTSLVISEFAQGQVLTNVNDFEGICVNMEHSYMGDLQIQLTCPSGQSVTMHQYQPNGASGYGTFLGTPIDNDLIPDAGIGATYCWTPAASQTWASAAGGTGTTLPPGDYAPQQSFNLLQGCTLNGEWTITICDNLTLDNGYIFSWGLNFNDAIYPSLETFTPTITNEEWLSDPTIVSTPSNSSIVVSPTTAGNYDYTFQVTDNFGCIYDTALTITVFPISHPSCLTCDSVTVVAQNDTIVCPGDTINLKTTLPFTPSDFIFSSANSRNIPDNASVSDTIAVAGMLSTQIATNTIAAICLDISHNNVQDLDIRLVAPSGETLELTTDNGGNGDNFTGTCFTASATTNITNANAPFTGEFTPEGSMNDLLGAFTNGNWVLLIVDDATGTTGTLNSWSISFASNYSVGYSWSPTHDLLCDTCSNTRAVPSETTGYIVNIFDSFGCGGTDTVNVTVLDVLHAPVVVCDTATFNSVTFSWNSIQFATSYEVNINGTGWITPNGTLTHTVTGLLPKQAADIQVRAIGPCEAGNIGTLTCDAEPCEHEINVDSITHITCPAGSDGAVAISATGTIQPFTYNIAGNPTQNTGIFTGLASDTIDIFVTDAIGCAEFTTVIINEPPDFQIAPTISNIACSGTASGQIGLTATGGTGDLTYLWSNNETTPTISDLSIGTYTVTVTDSRNCTSSADFTISEPVPLMISFSNTAITCYGENTGATAPIVSGGTYPYQYDWAGITSQDSALSNVSAGIYSVTVTDANNCTISASDTITQPAAPVTLTMDFTSISCFGFSDGSASVVATGGNGNYSYNWQPTGQNTTNITNLSIGSYIVEVMDSNGCAAVDSVLIEEPAPITALTQSEAATCFEKNDGQATALVSGGTPYVGGIYEYVWSNGDVTQTTTGLIGGQTYFVTVLDSNGCFIIRNITIEHPDSISATMEVDSASCHDGTDGEATVYATGGTPSFTYLWSADAQTTVTATDLAAGEHTVTITDTNGCVLVETLTIFEPLPLALSTTVEDVTCKGRATGIANAQAAGGTPFYNIRWGMTGSSQDGIQATGLVAGIHGVTLTDAQGCTLVDSVEILEPEAALTASFEKEDISCFGDANGQIDIVSMGGVIPHQYSLDGENFRDNPNMIGLDVGYYTLYVKDDNDCIFVDSFEIIEPPLLEVELGEPITIDWGVPFTLLAQPENGMPPFSYEWLTKGQLSCSDCSEPTISNLPRDEVLQVIVTDGNGCTARDEVNIYVSNARYIFLANAFTPNGDNINDVFFVQGGGGVKEVLYLRVFDRWGELIYQERSLGLNQTERGWDGTHNGKQMKPGTYIWVAEIQFEDGEQVIYKGSVLLLK